MLEDDIEVNGDLATLPDLLDKLDALVGKANLSRNEMLEVNSLLESAGSFDYSKQKVREYAARAVKALDGVGEGQAKEALKELADITDNVEKWKFVRK